MFHLVSKVRSYQKNVNSTDCNKLEQMGIDFYDTLGTVVAFSYFSGDRTPTLKEITMIIGFLFISLIYSIDSQRAFSEALTYNNYLF